LQTKVEKLENSMVMNNRYLFAFVVIAVLLAGCKSSRKTVVPKPKPVVAASSVKPTPPAPTRPTKSIDAAPASKPAPTSSKPVASAYPAMEYYGDNWNTEHVRLYSSSAPAGSVTLNIGTGDFSVPACGKVNSEFGRRSGSMHTGIDLKVALNDPVYCAFDGMVRMARTYGDYGLVVVVRHENGLETLYGHLNSIAVKSGQWIKAGDKIGGGGRTGRASGVHLHFETRFKGEPFNPRMVIDFENCQIKTATLTLNENSYKLYGKNLQPTAPVAPKPQNTLEHVVVKGDTLYNISKRYSTTVDALRRINHLSENATLQIGQKLQVGK
jgi:murein DD-endopeptidase MepM/ murein hydrolase activator NlpD